MPVFSLACHAIPISETVYLNASGTNYGVFYSPFEVGDEIFLDGTARHMTEFDAEYYGEFIPNPDATARLKIYANDGRFLGGPTYEPGTIVYQSGNFLAFAGYNTLVIGGLDVVIPSRLTWTVQFGGSIDGSIGNRAGLLLRSPPTTGNSFGDFWLKNSVGWNLFGLNDGLVPGDFASRILAAGDQTFRMDNPIRLSDGAYQIHLVGPAGRAFILETTPNLKTWRPVLRAVFAGGGYNYIDTRANLDFFRAYRASLVSDEPPKLTAPVFQAGSLIFNASGPNGFNYAVQGSADQITWADVQTGTFTTRDQTVTISNVLSSPLKFYRIVLRPRGETIVADAPIRMSNPSVQPNDKFQFTLTGPNLFNYRLQSSTNRVAWVDVTNGVFTTSSETITQTNRSGSAQKFFRVILGEPVP